MHSININDNPKRYQIWRDNVYRMATEDYAAAGFSFREITREDISQADNWDKGRSENLATWWWRDYYDELHNIEERFDLAVQYGKELYALCYGISSGGDLILEIKVIQKNPRLKTGEIKALSIVLYAAELYADSLGAREIRICEPINEKLVQFYETFGYKVARNTRGMALYLIRLTN
jgi:hypothetical protein